MATICLVVGASLQAQGPGSPPRTIAAALPGRLMTALQRAGCRVPEPPAELSSDSSAVVPHVAYRARIRSASALDWVVLCERAGRREVVVDSMCEGASLHYWTGRRWMKLPAYCDKP
jgi:hypothetical protein